MPDDIEEDEETLRKYSNKYWDALAPTVFSERKLRKMRERVALMHPDKIKIRFRSLLEDAATYNNQPALARAFLLFYASVDDSLKKELDEISAEIQHNYLGY